MSRDPLSDLLRAVRVRGAVFYYVSCGNPWSAEAPPSGDIAEAVMPGCDHVIEYHMIAKGNGWAAVASQPPVKLATGDIVMFPQGDRHVLSSAPGIEPVRQTAEWVFSTRHVPKPMPIGFHHGVVEPGSPLPVEAADMIAVCGFLGCDLRPFNPLIAALPHILHLPANRASGWTGRVIEQAVVESSSPRPGGSAVLERLAEMMFVDAARRYSTICQRVRPAGSPACAIVTSARRSNVCMNVRIGPGRSTTSHAKSACRAPRCMNALSNSWVTRRCTIWPTGASSSAAAAAGIQSHRGQHRLDVGYESEAAFSRAFKRRADLPPAAWRKAQGTA
jgi:hypothetical protein